jgi:DNA mismatch repair ATPase MutS
MKILNNNSTYKLKNGISDIKGGIKVLKELDYDETIIKGANEIIDKINI